MLRIFMIGVVSHPLNVVDLEFVKQGDSSERLISIELNKLKNLLIQYLLVFVAAFKEILGEHMHNKF